MGGKNRKRVRYNIKYIFTYINRKAKPYAESLMQNFKKITYFGYAHTAFSVVCTGLTYLAFPVIAISYGCVMLGTSALVICVDISEHNEAQNKIK